MFKFNGGQDWLQTPCERRGAIWALIRARGIDRFCSLVPLLDVVYNMLIVPASDTSQPPPAAKTSHFDNIDLAYTKYYMYVLFKKKEHPLSGKFT